MKSGSDRTNTWLTVLKRTAYWVIPIVGLAIILAYVDLASLRRNLAMTDPWKVVYAWICFPAIVVIAALRWTMLTRIVLQRQVPFNYMLRHHWTGMIVGKFSPGSIGFDIYRVIMAGRRFGKYLLNATVIVLEKLIGLTVISLMILVMYPAAASYFVSPPAILDRIRTTALLLLAAVAVLTGILSAAKDSRVAKSLFSGLERLISRSLEKTMRRLKGNEVSEITLPDLPDLLGNFFKPRYLFVLVALSVGMHLVAALGHQILLSALGCSLSYTVNLFVIPLVTFIFFVPISFGSLGIREGTYIVVYGLFGVPMETALLLSFFTFFFFWVNAAIAGLLMLSRVGNKT